MIRSTGGLTWLRLARTYQKIRHAANVQLRPFGLRLAQFDVLAQVGAHEGMTQQNLGQVLVVTKGNVCHLLDRMEQLGWIARRPSGRANSLHLTPDGRALFDTVVPAHEAWVADQFQMLTSDEQSHLRSMLHRLDRKETEER